MDIIVQRLGWNLNATLGALFINGKRESFTLEDIYRPKKIMAETRIPAGIYPLSIANWGDMNARYQKRFGAAHHGMIMINNVPNFAGILFHMGIDKSHTEGCILVGDAPDSKLETLRETEPAYKRFYAKVISELLAKRPVRAVVQDEARILSPF